MLGKNALYSRFFGITLLSFACGLVPFTLAHAEKTRIGGGVELLYDSNVNRAAAPDREHGEAVVTGEVNGVRSYLLTYRSGVVARAGLQLVGHTDYTDLSYIAASGRVLYRYQHNPGFTGTILEVAGDLEVRQHADSKIRNGWIGDLTIGAGKHLTDRLRLGTGLGFEGRAARDSVYDTSTARIWGSADFRWSPTITAYGSVNFIDGDQVFNSAYGGTQANLMQYGKASAPDPALRRAFGGIVPMAYRVDARTWVYDVGVNLNLGNARALDFSVGYFDAEAKKNPVTYDGFSARVNYFHRFR